ncbi:hypothetical protein QVD17_34661 [Tagetes erecta]|uniref:Uncharacterized protein n=1 Tax=Tagetes erecta TaxID=13708 RepID=A0AAD8JZV1_TARER|nr:hypothetical protein QVD17_34661 [Tagetes erecta]
MVTDDSGSKTSNDAVRPSRNVNQFNPVEVVANDYGCKTADNHHAIVQKKQERNIDQSKLSAAKNASRGPNPRFVTEQIPTDGGDSPEPVHEKKQKQKHKHKHKQKQHRYKDNHSIIEKQERDTDQSDSKLSTERNDFRGRNPRFVAEQIVTGGATQLLEPESEPVQEKKQKQKQHRYKGNYLTVENKEDESDQSNSKHSKKKNSSKSRNSRFLTDQIPGGDNTPGPEPVQEKKQNQKQHHYNDNYTIVEKHDNDTDQSNSKRSTKKNSSGSRNPRLVTDRIPAGGSDQEPESVQEKKQNRYNDNHTIVENDTDQSNSKRPRKKISSKSRNPRLVTDQIPAGDSTPEPELVQEKKQQRYNDNHIVVEHDTDQTNPQRSRKNNSSRSRNPRYVTDQIPNEDSTPEPVQEKKQNQKQNSYREERRSRNQERSRSM